MTLGEIVARDLGRIRKDRGLSQEELAHRVGINRNYVGMIERQENAPTVAMIERLAAVLEVSPTILFDPGLKEIPAR